MTAGQASLQREVEATARAAAELAAVSLVAGGEEGQQEESIGVDPLDSWSPEPDNLPVQLLCQQLCISNSLHCAEPRGPGAQDLHQGGVAHQQAHSSG